MKLAMLGCGYVANMYRLTLPLHPELALVGACDSDPARARKMAELTGCRVYESLEQMLADARVEMVLNLTNPRAHYETTRQCLEAGKHVYTEKPLALDIEQAKQLVALAREKNVQISSAPCTLLNEAAQTTWKALRDKVVGDVRLVYAEMDDGMVHKMPVQKWINEAGVPWPYVDEFETGCTIEHAGYVLTWLCAFFGPAESITADAACLVVDKVPGERVESADDFTVAFVRFANGVIARLTCGVYAPVDHALRFFGEDGVLEVADPRRDRSPIRHRRYVTIRRARKLMPVGRKLPLLGGKRKQVKYRGSQQRDFCSAIAEMAAAIEAERTCRLSAEFCLHVNEMVLAIHDARRMGTPYRMTTTFSPIEPMPWAEEANT
ncbi:MAG: Gfo/Idh/MocA family oxidoreductase [Phycisphaeraceae bacterium]|nr:Gfo/Idh/MocA family oxidoreductase [Phycisphaeraceae bacterium]